MSTPPPPQAPYGQYQQPQGAPPNNYLVWAIISIFLCWPLAIPAIIFATQVNTKWQQGDVAGAHEASQKAKNFSLWATVLGGILVVIWIILFAAGVFAASTVPAWY